MVSQSKSEAAYQLIRERIAAHETPPGARLVLAQLADELGMSVVPVREAIRRLEAEGHVVFERNVGARVAHLDRTEYGYTMEALAITEGAAIALAAPYVTPEVMARARAVNDEIRDMLREFDPKAFDRLNRSFHSTLYEQCPNPLLVETVRQGWARLAMVRDPAQGFLESRARESVREHGALLDLIERGAASGEIERFVRKHRHATQRAVLAR